MCGRVILLAVLCAGVGTIVGINPAIAQTAPTVGIAWDPYTPPADFAKMVVRRGTIDCGLPGPLQPVLINGVEATVPVPATGAFPTTWTDPNPPKIDGTLCYELTVVDTAGNTGTSNRASKVVNLNPPPAVQGLRVQ